MDGLTQQRDKPVILHATTGLNQGGAERVLAMVVTDPALAGFRHVVYSLLAGGVIAHELNRAGVQVVSANMSRSGNGVLNIASLIRAARSLGPDVVQGWMYHGNLLASTLGAFSRTPVVWGIHHTSLPAGAALKARLNMRVSALASWISPKMIVYCSDSARQEHAKRKFRACARVISNGVDTQRYRPAPEQRNELRRRFHIPQDAFVIGSVGRFDAQKDYLCLLKAAREWRQTFAPRKMAVVLCGKGLAWDNPVVAGWIRELELTGNVMLLGPSEPIPDVLNTFDVFTMSSCYGEALPLALLEAMSSGLPCVVTDVGDCSAVIGRSELTVSPGVPGSLCFAWQKIAALGQASRSAIGAGMRQRVIDHWSRDRMAGEYLSVYERFVLPVRVRPPATAQGLVDLQ